MREARPRTQWRESCNIFVLDEFCVRSENLFGFHVTLKEIHIFPLDTGRVSGVHRGESVAIFVPP